MSGVAKDWRVRFVSKYKVGAPDECWNWTAHVPPKGYGQMAMDANGYRETSHRAAYIYHRGDIPTGIQVLHSCDNKKCVNPNHLHLGTRIDNAREAVERGLYVRGSEWKSLHSASLPKGENHKRAKLTADKVRRIRASSKSGVALAREFGMAPTNISRIRRGLAWTHVDG